MTQLKKIFKLGSDLQICRILNGMWQVAGGHGQINLESAVDEMVQYHDDGFTTWDMADIYGPAEEFLGEFRKKLETDERLSNSQALTKFVPNPGPMTRSIVEHYIDKSITRMNVKSIDLIQFHWWDYNDVNYLDALNNLSKLQDDGKIRHIGITNFDTERMDIMIKHGFNLISNQVQYSILDQRAEVKMVPFCQKHNMNLLTYGTLLGGFLSEKYIRKLEPVKSDLNTLSLQKYKNMIDTWGGWNLFQELLLVLEEIGKKHNTSIANVGTKFILDKPRVAGVIIGARLGISQHRDDNAKVFELVLDADDNSKIISVTSKARDLFEIIGDCGSEYR
uniref:Oxidoreductase domain-containing protein n=1 Tax=uncultured marine thaumarchaeote SAT1000_48_A08 TaxID=1456414 RepID=A0A075IBB2_9ARCH|nr:oxidoreductase domain-containing protein [uncultured marine thaumarchaeote SAT1000_48_A08]